MNYKNEHVDYLIKFELYNFCLEDFGRCDSLFVYFSYCYDETNYC